MIDTASTLGPNTIGAARTAVHAAGLLVGILY